ncbi:pentatricopeptide repeat-containing protein At3g22670, mitochondrial [Humulus lupulus]|uniref:pentatricopeptide repeat-containing protein At3g22670, mitochondrial n=1 Tax=Humulus lupulus TaxID=3486 RepID=UPI002B40E8E4|nr:pentatricopeptide repeat-containing protein At3g22670, mitochondrial [Humulus lupulus]
MLSKLQRATTLFSATKPNTNALRRFLFLNSLCTSTASTQVTESPELPNWVKVVPSKTATDEGDDDDDFVIPSLAHWVESPILRLVELEARKQLLNETTEPDIDKLSRVLKKRYASPEEVAQALDRCGLNLSVGLVEQVLNRFSNQWVSAFGFFTWAGTQTGYKHSPESYNLMVDILGKTDKFQLMWGLIEVMSYLDGYISMVTMAKVIRRLARAHLYEEAIAAFRGIERLGISKDISGLNILLDTLVKENSIEHAQEVFLEFRDVIPVNTTSFNILVHGWCKVRKFDTARATMEDMEKHGYQPNAFTYTCFVESYCHEKDFRNVDAILDEMKAKGCAPTVVTYTIIMHALGKAKQINEALGVCEKMKRDGCVPDSSFFNSLIFILGKAGRLKDAEDVFDDMPKQGATPDAVTYNTLISCYCDHSQEEKALKLLKKMEDESCKPDLKTYAALLKMCCKKRRMKVLHFLLNHMFNNDISIEISTYSILISGLCKSGRVEQAYSFFKEMISKDMIPQDSVYNRLKKELEAKNMVKEKEDIEKLVLRVSETIP